MTSASQPPGRAQLIGAAAPPGPAHCSPPPPRPPPPRSPPPPGYKKPAEPRKVRMLIIDQRDITARSPVLHCGFWEGAPLIASTVSVPAPPPQQPQPVSQGQTPLNSQATQEARLERAPIPPLPAGSPEWLRRSDPPHTHRSTPFAQKPEVEATTVPSAQVPLGWQAPRGPRTRRTLSRLAGAGCLCVCCSVSMEIRSMRLRNQINTSLFRSPSSQRKTLTCHSSPGDSASRFLIEGIQKATLSEGLQCSLE